MISLWQRIEERPPILVRMMARHRHGPPLTNAEIAAASGLAPYQVAELSFATSWRGVDIYTMKAFTIACGMDFTDRQQWKRTSAYLDRVLRGDFNFKYLRTSPDWKTLYEPMLAKFYGTK